MRYVYTDITVMREIQVYVHLAATATHYSSDISSTSSEKVRMWTQYVAQGQVKIKILSSLLRTLFLSWA